jgi:hypothetical protein
MKKAKTFLMVVAFVLSLAVIAPASYAGIIIGAPGDLNSGNCFPFGCSGGTRYQQVYNNNQFSSPVTINTISFYNKNYSAGSIQSADYTLNLSITSKAVNGLDTSNLDNNVTGTNVLFFHGNLGGAIDTTTHTFTISGAGFAYDPAYGNLLLEILKDGGSGSTTVYLDAHSGTFGDISSRAHNFGSGFESWGLVTGFNAAPVPLPPSLLLLAPGLLGLAGLKRKYLP